MTICTGILNLCGWQLQISSLIQWNSCIPQTFIHSFIHSAHKLRVKPLHPMLYSCPQPNITSHHITSHNRTFSPKCSAALWMKTLWAWMVPMSIGPPDLALTPQCSTHWANILQTMLFGLPVLILGLHQLPSTSDHTPRPWYVVLYLLRPSSYSFVGVLSPFLAATFQKVNRSDFQ